MTTEGDRLERRLIGLIEFAGYRFKRDFPVRSPYPVHGKGLGLTNSLCVLDGVIPHDTDESVMKLVEITYSGTWDSPHKQVQRRILKAAGLDPEEVLMLGKEDEDEMKKLLTPDQVRGYLRPKVGW